MSVVSMEIARGPGWRAADIFCAAGPGDRPYEEEHAQTCVALVTGGTFRYRAAQGEGVLAPGGLVLGNPGTCYECGHDHSTGDRCLSFHFSGEFFDDVLAGVAGARRAGFRAARLPPSDALARLGAEAEAARDDRDAEWLGEVAAGIAGAAAAADIGAAAARAPDAGEERRVARALRLIEASAGEALTLPDLAAEACLSRFHFLRVFSAVAGMTPYRFLLHRRMAEAARRLRRGDEDVSAIALDAGFGDLSTFNRRFRRVMGETPLSWRRRRGRQ